MALCVELFLPLSRGSHLPSNVAPALAMMRDAERHLGRWLVLAQVSVSADDPGPLAVAADRMKDESVGRGRLGVLPIGRCRGAIGILRFGRRSRSRRV